MARLMSALPWRPAPPDRRAPRLIARTRCPAANLCGCCMGQFDRGHFNPDEPDPKKRQITDCRMPHPPADRDCRPPYPKTIPPCPERKVRYQGTPDGQAIQERACIECGLGTARVHTDGLPWCGGRHASPNPGDCPECGWPVDPAGGVGRHGDCGPTVRAAEPAPAGRRPSPQPQRRAA